MHLYKAAPRIASPLRDAVSEAIAPAGGFTPPITGPHASAAPLAPPVEQPLSWTEAPTPRAAAPHPWLKLISGAARGALAAALLGLTACSSLTGPGAPARGAPLGHRAPVALSQLDYPQARLGEGHYTIASSGCLLTSLTMASSMLHERHDLSPLSANALVLKNGGFSGSAIELGPAASALGLSVEHRRALSAGSAKLLGARLDAALAKGCPVVMGVDYQPGGTSSVSGADHFICAYAQLGPGRYAAMDPAGGLKVELCADEQGLLVYRGAPERRISELVFLSRAPLPSPR